MTATPLSVLPMFASPSLSRSIPWPAAWRRRTLVATVLGIVSLGVVAAAIASAMAAAQIRGAAGDAALRAAQTMAERLSAEMAACARGVELLSELGMLRSGSADPAVMRRSLEALADGLPAYAWIGLTDADGRVLAGTAGILEGQSIAMRPVFRNGRLAPWTGDVHEAVLLAAYAPRRPGEAAARFVDFAAPVRGADGRLRGVLALHLSWQWAGGLRDAVARAQGLGMSTQLEVVGADGAVLLGPAADPAPGPALPTLAPEVPQTLDGRWESVAWSDGREAVTAGALSRPTAGFRGFGWRVIARAEPGAIEAAIAEAQRKVWQASLGAASLLAALVAGLFGGGALAGLGATAPGAWRSRTERRADVAELAATFARLRASMASPQADAVTGLPTRADLAGLAEASTRVPGAAGVELCVLCIDLDDFRTVNERFGREIGDAALGQVASRLLAAAREDDVVLRLGGDGFVVIAPCTAGRGDALTERLASRVLEQLRRPLNGSGHSKTGVGGCVGTARWQPETEPLLETVARAEEALLAAKRAGRGQLRHSASPCAQQARRAEARLS